MPGTSLAPGDTAVSQTDPGPLGTEVLAKFLLGPGGGCGEGSGVTSLCSLQGWEGFKATNSKTPSLVFGTPNSGLSLLQTTFSTALAELGRQREPSGHLGVMR